MSDFKSYAQFNSLTITGRVSHAEVREYNNSEFLSVTLISDLITDGKGVAVQFTNSNGMLAMFKEAESNLLGRQITVTGHLAEFSETYFNKKTGKREMLQRPRLTLKQAQVFSGGYGAKKRSESEEIGEVMEYKAPVDNAEELAF
jgi:hypothetical protein